MSDWIYSVSESGACSLVRANVADQLLPHDRRGGRIHQANSCSAASTGAAVIRLAKVEIV